MYGVLFSAYEQSNWNFKSMCKQSENELWSWINKLIANDCLSSLDSSLFCFYSITVNESSIHNRFASQKARHFEIKTNQNRYDLFYRQKLFIHKSIISRQRRWREKESSNESIILCVACRHIKVKLCEIFEEKSSAK